MGFFFTNLTTVYGPANYIFNADSAGQWVKFPLSTPWSYTPESNFVVEYSIGANKTNQGIDLMASTIGHVYYTRTMGASRDSIRAYNTAQILILDLGLDFQNVGLGREQNIQTLGVFPNPAHGQVMLSLKAQKPIGNLNIYLRNLSGQVVLQQVLMAQGKEVFRALDLSHLIPGLYTLELRTAQGDQLSRKVILR